MEGDVTLNDGSVVRCRQDSSTAWMIIKAGGGKVFGIEMPTEEEKLRWTIANVATYGKFSDYTHMNVRHEPRKAGEPHPEGWFTKSQCYRNEADEAAAIARWRERTGR